VLDGERSDAKAFTHAERDIRSNNSSNRIEALTKMIRQAHKKNDGMLNRKRIKRLEMYLAKEKKRHVSSPDAQFKSKLVKQMANRNLNAVLAPFEADAQIAKMSSESTVALAIDSDILIGHSKIDNAIRLHKSTDLLMFYICLIF
jgi:carbamoylphosphate synthase small subunit